MRRWSYSILTVTLLYALTLIPNSKSVRADDNAAPPPPPQNGNNRDGARPPGPPHGFHLLPPFVRDKLDLTDDQKQQLADLEKETKDKLSKILTADQMKTVETARPPRGPGGPGGPGGGQRGQGGHGGQGGPGGGAGPDGAGGPPN